MAIVISMMSKKGGAGKSTMTKLMASAFLFTGKKCLLIDMDESDDSVEWWQTGVQNDLTDEKLIARRVETGEELFEIINKHEPEVDFIIIDTKGEGVDYAVELASVSDVLLVPCMNAKGDRKRALETLSWYNDLKERSENPSALPALHIVLARVQPGLFTHVRGNPKPDKIGEREFERHYEIIDEFNPLYTMVPEKAQYREMDERGVLGAIIEKMRASPDPKDRVRVTHWEVAMAHAITLINNVFSGRKMRQEDGA